MFKKKREIKAMGYEKKFNQLQSSGRLESFLSKKSEEIDKKKFKKTWSLYIYLFVFLYKMLLLYIKQNSIYIYFLLNYIY